MQSFTTKFNYEDLMKNPVNFGRYNDSINMAFGLNGLSADFDILNNEYIEVMAYEYNKGSVVPQAETSKLVRTAGSELELCDMDRLKNWVEESVL